MSRAAPIKSDAAGSYESAAARSHFGMMPIWTSFICASHNGSTLAGGDNKYLLLSERIFRESHGSHDLAKCEWSTCGDLMKLCLRLGTCTCICLTEYDNIFGNVVTASSFFLMIADFNARHVSGNRVFSSGELHSLRWMEARGLWLV